MLKYDIKYVYRHDTIVMHSDVSDRPTSDAQIFIRKHYGNVKQYVQYIMLWVLYV